MPDAQHKEAPEFAKMSSVPFYSKVRFREYPKQVYTCYVNKCICANILDYQYDVDR